MNCESFGDGVGEECGGEFLGVSKGEGAVQEDEAASVAGGELRVAKLVGGAEVGDGCGFVCAGFYFNAKGVWGHGFLKIKNSRQWQRVG